MFWLGLVQKTMCRLCQLNHCKHEKENILHMAHHANPVEVEKCLKGIDFPAKKQDLIKHAQKQGAEKEVLDTIKDLPREDYNNAADVTRAIGEMDRP